MKKLVTFSLALTATIALCASNVITYTGTEKLPEITATSSSSSGLHMDAFNVAIIDHTYTPASGSNSLGTGTITFAGEVTTIGKSAFHNSYMATIEIPNSVTTIGEDAFASCYRLTTLDIPSSVISIGRDAFNYSSLTEVTLHEGLISIESYAFESCGELVSINIPNTVKRIGDRAFAGCKKLTTINIPISVSDFGYGIFNTCNSLPVENGLRYAGTYLVGPIDKTQTTYTVKEGTIQIGSNAFENCSTMTSIALPNSLQSIECSAFGYCKNLASISIPNNVIRIGQDAFAGCINLATINIPQNVKDIRLGAFLDCSKLTAINVNAANAVYSSVDGVLFNYAKDTIIQYPTGKTDNTYTIPNTVKVIGAHAFYDNQQIASVTIPSTVSYLGYYAFAYCSNLADIYCYATIPPVNEYSFDNIFEEISSHCYIHIPVGTVRAYQMAQSWRRFLHFYEISTLPGGTTTEQVSVTVTNNYATFTWPVNPTASSYTLEIKKKGEVFCSLIFNSLGQLVGMQFAPSRGGARQTPSAESTAYGYSFVVTGLDEGEYDYTFSARDASDNVLQSFTGEFSTSGNSIEEVNGNSQSLEDKKVLMDGQIIIYKDGRKFSVTGQAL